MLLVLRVSGLPPGPETVRAFAAAARRVMRDGDAIAHDAGGDWFALAMLAPARERNALRALDARAALERIAAAMSLAIDLPMETGWWLVASAKDVEAFDVTIERALERGARERERGEFLATVGHELRTPLTSIRGYVETLLEGEADVTTSRRFLEIVRRETLRLSRLVDGMLEFSLLDISSGIATGTCDLRAVANAAAESLAPLAARAGITVRIEIEAGAYAQIDADAAMHAIVNLVENGVKYGRRGGCVRVGIERQDAFICLIVDDDGPGLAPEERERIFANGARGSRAGDRHGSGIGLAIVRTIVEHAGGTVRAVDSPLRGARFIVRLRAAEAELPAPAS